MLATATLLSALIVAAPAEPDVRTLLVKLGPLTDEAGQLGRSPAQARAVVLIHGLGLRPLSREKAHQPALCRWQKPEAAVVRGLAQESDVWAVGYGQNAPVEKVAPMVGREVRRVKALGYKEVVLVGHSAGALVARHIVEDDPQAGVTKALQVCAPNLGSGWAALQAVR